MFLQAFSKLGPGPRQAALDRPQGFSNGFGHFLVVEALNIDQNCYHPELGRQVPKAIFYHPD